MLKTTPLAALVLGAVLHKRAQAATPEEQRELALARAFYLIRQPQHEGFVASSKGPRGTDHKGIPTIGHGINLRTSGNRLQRLFGKDRERQLQAGSPITRHEAYLAARSHLKDDAAALRKSIPGFSKFHPDVRGAAMSIRHNSPTEVGPNTNFVKNMRSAAQNPLLATNPAAVPGLQNASAEVAYNHKNTAFGTIKRRVAEANVMRGASKMTPYPAPTRGIHLPTHYKKHTTAVGGKPAVTQ